MVKFSRSPQQRVEAPGVRRGASAAPSGRSGPGLPAVGEHPHQVLTTQHRGDLEADQLWRGQRLTAKAGTSGIPVGPRRQPTRLQGRWRQRRARSPCTVLTASAKEMEPPDRPPARSRTPSNVGWLASAISRERRYSCSVAQERRKVWSAPLSRRRGETVRDTDRRRARHGREPGPTARRRARPRPTARPRAGRSWPEAQVVADALRTETIGGALLLAARGGRPGLGQHARGPTPTSTLRDYRDRHRSARHLDLTVGHWAADGLLAIFFFVAGLELKREFVAGDLRDPRQAAVPDRRRASAAWSCPPLVYLAGHPAAPAAARCAAGRSPPPPTSPSPWPCSR